MQDKATTTIAFDSVQSLYNDMTTHNQSFTKGENEYSGNSPILEGSTIYRLVELKRNCLEFHSNRFGGSDLRIVGSIQKAEKIDSPDNAFAEYHLHIAGRNEPFILLACKNRRTSMN